MKTITMLFLSLLIAVSTCGADASLKPRPVEVWTGGDDGLTQRFKGALEHELKSAPEFALSNGRQLGTLIVLIPTHVEWKQVGRRTRVSYKVEFTTVDDRVVSRGKGSCWEDTLDDCAVQVVNGAKEAARKLD